MVKELNETGTLQAKWPFFHHWLLLKRLLEVPDAFYRVCSYVYVYYFVISFNLYFDLHFTCSVLAYFCMYLLTVNRKSHFVEGLNTLILILSKFPLLVG